MEGGEKIRQREKIQGGEETAGERGVRNCTGEMDGVKDREREREIETTMWIER